MSLDGQRIVILGGTSGIGFATAQAAAQEGASIVIASSRRESVDRARAALPKGTEGLAVDLSDETAIAGLFATLGAFDHLVYTAGENLELGALNAMSLDGARRFWNVRYWGAVTAAKYASPHIRPGGSIVLTTGIANLRPRKGWTVAAGICGAMEAFTRALAVELAPVRVNAVSPGVVRTPLWGAMSEADREAMYKSVGMALPVGRVGNAEDVAKTYLYLMHEDFSTGQVIVVDGGAVLV